MSSNIKNIFDMGRFLTVIGRCWQKIVGENKKKKQGIKCILTFRWFVHEIFWNNSKTQSYIQQGFIITQRNICYEKGEKLVTVIIQGSSTHPYFISLEEILMCFKLDLDRTWGMRCTECLCGSRVHMLKP